MLEEEIYGENSPIWDADFTMPASEGAQLGPQTGLCVDACRYVAVCSSPEWCILSECVWCPLQC